MYYAGNARVNIVKYHILLSEKLLGELTCILLRVREVGSQHKQHLDRYRQDLLKNLSPLLNWSCNQAKKWTMYNLVGPVNPDKQTAKQTDEH